MDYTGLLFTLTFLCLCSVSVGQLNQCSSTVVSNGGDIILPVILQLHEPENNQCGRISLTEFQVVVAIHWLMEEYLNGNTPETQFIPGVKFGYRIHDDCGLRSLATKRTLDIMPEVLSNDLQFCGDVTSNDRIIAGVFGTTLSETSITVAKLVEKAHVPLIGFSATLPELRNTDLYPNYIPTVPPDTEQVKAILELVKILEWKFMGVIFSDDTYGRHGYNAIKDMASDLGICIRLNVTIPRDVLTNDEIFTQTIYSLSEILKEANNGNFGIVYFGQPGPAAMLLRYIYQGSVGSLGFESITWLMSEAVGDSPEVKEAVKDENIDVYLLTPPTHKFEEFETFFLDVLSNTISDSSNDKFQPFTAEYLKSMYKCDISQGCSLGLSALKSKFVQHEYLQSVIDAVYLEATVMKAIHSRLCNGISGLCPALITRMSEQGLMKEYMNAVLSFREIKTSFLPASVDIQRNLTVSSTGNVEISGQGLYKISVLLRDVINEVGTYTAAGLNVQKADINEIFKRNNKDLGSSFCSQTCASCISFPELPYAFSRGDLYILGLFSIHSQGDGYSCGGWRSKTSSPAALLSFMNSVELYANNKGIQIGGIAVDDCYNPLHANNILTKIFTGNYKLHDPATGDLIHHSKIIGVVGASSSGVTIVTSFQTNNLKLPLISYAASSPDLDNKHSYPYFLRTVPSDTMQADVMVKILRRLKITYAGVVYIDSNYGWNGAMQFQKTAEMYEICVHKPIAVPVINTNNDLKEIINTIDKYYIKVVIFFGIDTLAIRFINILNLLRRTDLTFIGSETWGTNPEIIQGLTENAANAAMGSLSLVVDSPYRLDDSFVSYVSRIISNPDSTYNPWLKRFIMDTFQCNYPGSFEIPYSQTCPKTFDATAIIGLSDDQRVVHTSYAVRSMTETLIQAIVVLCQSKLDARCVKYLQENIGTVVNNMKDVELTNAESKTFRVFDDNMNGAIGFKIYNVQRKSSGGFHYVQVGHYEKNGLTLNEETLEFYDFLGNPTKKITADCANVPGCEICASKVNISTSAVTGSTATVTRPVYSGGDADCTDLLPAVVVLAIICILLLAVICFFGFMMYRAFQRLDKIRKKAMYGIGEDHYDVANATSLPLNTMKEKTFIKPHLKMIGRASTETNISFNPNANGNLQRRRNTTSSFGSHSRASENGSNGSNQLSMSEIRQPVLATGTQGYEVAKNWSDSSTNSVFRRPSANEIIAQRPMHTVPESSPPVRCSTEDYVEPATTNTYLELKADSPAHISQVKQQEGYFGMKGANKPQISQKPALPVRKNSSASPSDVGVDFAQKIPKASKSDERPLWAHVQLGDTSDPNEEYMNLPKPEKGHGVKNPTYLNDEQSLTTNPGGSDGSNECVSPIELKDDYMKSDDIWKTNVRGVDTSEI